MFEDMTSSQRFFIVAIPVCILLFVFRDQIGTLGGQKITSDTQVNWSSCTSKRSEPFVFIKCTEPTPSWMAYREGPFGDARLVERSRLKSNAQQLSIELLDIFKAHHRLSADMINTSEDITLGGEHMLWDEVFAQQLLKQNMYSTKGEVLGNGHTMVRFGDNKFRVLSCVSQTDSGTFCENAGVDVLYSGLEETLSANN